MKIEVEVDAIDRGKIINSLHYAVNQANKRDMDSDVLHQRSYAMGVAEAIESICNFLDLGYSWHVNEDDVDKEYRLYKATDPKCTIIIMTEDANDFDR